jgi:hypothetical protein
MTPATPIDPRTRVLAAAVNWADRAPSLVESTRELLAALANHPQLSAWVACRSRTAIDGWSDDWHGCVYIETPGGQLSWHYHDSHSRLFEHLPFVEHHRWDGHTTEEKYARIEKLTGADLARGPAADGQG